MVTYGVPSVNVRQQAQRTLNNSSTRNYGIHGGGFALSLDILFCIGLITMA